METKTLRGMDFILHENGSKKIDQGKLIQFLEANGFHQTQIEGKVNLVDISQNLAQETSIYEIIQFLRNMLELFDPEVCSVFLKNPGSFVGYQKLLSLKQIDIFSDRDTVNTSKFFFKNCYCEISKDLISVKEYELLDSPVWKKRIIKRSYEAPVDSSPGQFELFCQKITGGTEERFLAFQSWYGYLMHRNREKGENKAVILYDEKMGEGDTANGRTGKSLLGEVLSMVREVVPFDGKDLKKNSVFKNQRLTHTSDLLFYDDYSKGQNLENLYSILTTGIEVEKKGKPAFYIPRAKAPKLLITSNYYIPGDGGDSDLARRYEFEISNYFSRKYQPENEFGIRFFAESWPEEEWNKFFYFLFKCVQVYLVHGLIEAEPLSLHKNKLISSTCEEFEEFAEVYFLLNERLDKRELHKNFIEYYSDNHKDLSINQFTRWCKEYSHQKGYLFNDKSSGGNFYCWFFTNNSINETEDEKN